MIQAGQRITRDVLNTLATLANNTMPGVSIPFHFYGRFHVVKDVASLTRLASANVGDYAVPRVLDFGGYIGHVYQLTALPGTTAGNWTQLDFGVSLATNSTVTRGQLAGVNPPPDGLGTTIVDLQEWDFAGYETFYLGMILPAEGTGKLGISGRQIFYRWNPAVGWMPIGGWAAELCRIRHFAFRALTCRNPLVSEAAAGRNVGIKEKCRISGPWPVATENRPDVYGAYAQQLFLENGPRQLSSPKIYLQTAVPGLQAEAGSLGRIVVYPAIAIDRIAGALKIRIGFSAGPAGYLRGSLVIFDVVTLAGDLGLVERTPIFASIEGNDLTVLGDARRVLNGAGNVTVLYFDTPFSGGEITFTLANYNPASTAQLPRSGQVTTQVGYVQGTEVFLQVGPNRGGVLRYEIDYAVQPALGLATNKLWSAVLAADVKSNPVFNAQTVGYPNVLIDDENQGALTYGLTPYPNPEPNPAGDPSLLPYPDVPNTNDNIYNSVIIAKTKPPLPFDFHATLRAFAPHNTDHEIQPYPIARDTSHDLPVITLPLPPYDPRSWTGFIYEITVSRKPDANGKFPANSSDLRVHVGAFGILGHPASQFSSLWQGVLPAGLNLRTWRASNGDELDPIVVLSPVPLSYQCAETVLVQCLFIPSVPLSDYGESLPVTYSPATDEVSYENERLKYVGIPILAHHYNDTAALLNLA